MRKPEPPRVQHLAVKLSPLPVDVVAKHWMAEVFQMHPNLVGPSRVQGALHQRAPGIVAEYAPARPGRATTLKDRHFLPMDGMPADRSLYLA